MTYRSAAELTRLRDRSRRLLAVFPHPDDESYGPAGTLAREGRHPDGAAVLLCLTKGKASSMGKARGLSPDEVGELRVERLEEVAAALPLDGLVVADLPDGGLARYELADLVRVVTEVLDAFRPQVVIAHDPRGVNAHADHIATHWAVRQALTGRKGVRLAMVAYPPEVVEELKPRLIFPTPEDEIDAVVHLTADEIDAKETALCVHEAFVTLKGDDPGKLRRPPVERYDFLGEPVKSTVDDVFAGIHAVAGG